MNQTVVNQIKPIETATNQTPLGPHLLDNARTSTASSATPSSARRISLSGGLILLAATLALSSTSLSSCAFRSGKAKGFRREVAPGVSPDALSSPGSLVPVNFGAASVPGTSTTTASIQSSERMTRPEREREDANKKAAVTPAKEEVAPQSDNPLDRILALCPAIESDLTAALTTVNQTERIQKYSALTNRCTTSADLFFLLGQDQARAGQNVQAGVSLDRALVIDPFHAEAKKLLAEVRAKLNNPVTQ